MKIQEGDTVFTVKDLNDEDNCFATHIVSTEGCGVTGVQQGTHAVNENTGDLRYNIPNFFFGFNPQQYQPEYSIKFFNAEGNPFYGQDIDYYLDQSQSDYYFINDNSDTGDTWIGVPQNGVREHQFPVMQQDALLEVFGTLDFQDPQEPGFTNLGTAAFILFRVRVLELGINCKHETTVFSNLFQSRQVDSPSPRTINLIRGSLCETCQAVPGGTNVVAHFMSTEHLTLADIVANKIRLFKTQADAQSNNLSEQIDSGRHGPLERDFGENNTIISYYYDGRDNRDNDPWSGSQQGTLECTRLRLRQCREDDRDDRDDRDGR